MAFERLLAGMQQIAITKPSQIARVSQPPHVHIYFGAMNYKERKYYAWFNFTGEALADLSGLGY